MNFDYIKALYRKDNKGVPQVWYAETGKAGIVNIYYGAVNGTLQHEEVRTSRKLEDEVRTRYLAKVKAGYKYLREVTDSMNFPVEEQLHSFLVTYLPAHRTGKDGEHLAMLAVAYNNNNNKIYDKDQEYLGQPKINGLRGAIFAVYNPGDLFKPISLRFVSREGTEWKSLGNLEEYLLSIIPNEFMTKMLYQGYGLDGELYLPGHTVNDINSYVKNVDSGFNKKIQYWCYDIIADDLTQHERSVELQECFPQYVTHFFSIPKHMDNTDRFVVIAVSIIRHHMKAKELRDLFIKLKFEGVMLRLKDALYQFGRRNSSLIKYKAVLDGIFEIVDIVPQSVSRPTLPMFILKNDINNELFDVRVSATTTVQKLILINKDFYIGKKMSVEFGERSGVKQVPFHCKTCNII